MANDPHNIHQTNFEVANSMSAENIKGFPSRGSCRAEERGVTDEVSSTRDKKIIPLVFTSSGFRRKCENHLPLEGKAY